MTVTEWLGYAKAVSDQWGLTPWVFAFLVLILAFAVYNKFFNKD